MLCFRGLARRVIFRRVAKRPTPRKQRLPGIARRHRKPDAADADAYQRADLENSGADGRRLGPRQLCRLQTQTAQSAYQRVGHRRQVQAQLIGAHRFSTDPARKQLVLFLDPVFHVAARTVEFLI